MDKVLIIDDSDFDRKMIKKAIASSRPDVVFTELSSGRSVAEIIAQEAPVMAIVDIRMPGMDGFEVLETIRAIPEFSDLTVIMVSGSAQAEDREMATARGANGYFVKPPSVADYITLGRDIYEQYLCCASAARPA
ncbi:MAG: response regulator [Litorimonas sp.]